MKLYIIGFGPGSNCGMTIVAQNAIIDSDIIVGYTVYIDLLKQYYPDKKYISTPMRKEVDRVRVAFEEAQKGQKVSIVCSGDSGVYGMSGLAYEISKEYLNVEIKVVPGVTAALSGGAILGAPLVHDFALISLSDLLTPMEKIEKRLDCAAMADFVICIYNPSSQKRAGYLKKACEIILQHQSPKTVCGYVKNIGRDGETSVVMTLEELKDAKVDMFTTVFVGNSQTELINGKMVTPRGYKNV